jgi:hypothetical protein
MAQGIDHQHLLGEWLHSHEEDTPTEMVFRPASYDFPLSRGRSGLRLNPDGTYVETGPAPDDRTRSAEGRWRLTADNALGLSPAIHGSEPRVLEVRSLTPERLVLRKG